MLLTVEDVVLTYGETADERVRALDGASLGVAAGEALGVMGRTGSGKSTLLEVMGGLVRPDEGRVLLDGRDVARDAGARRELSAALGMAFQRPERQFFETTVEREMAFALGCRGVRGERAREASRRACEAACLDFDAIAHRSPLALSGGQQRLVALASVLACEPSLLLLDEPTAGLDPRARAACLGAVRAAREAGCAVVLVSHDADAVALTCSRLAVMDAGRVVAEGPVGALLGDAARMRSLGLDGCRAARCALALREAGLDVADGALDAQGLAGRVERALGERGARVASADGAAGPGGATAADGASAPDVAGGGGRA